MPKLFANGKSEFGLPDIAFGIKQHKVIVCNALRMFVNVVVLVVFFESVNRLQFDLPLLRSQFVTTLVATTSNCATTAGGLHSCAETMYFASLTFLGLVSSFHSDSPYCRAARCSASVRFGSIAAHQTLHHNDIRAYCTKLCVVSQVNISN